MSSVAAHAGQSISGRAAEGAAKRPRAEGAEPSRAKPGGRTNAGPPEQRAASARRRRPHPPRLPRRLPPPSPQPGPAGPPARPARCPAEPRGHRPAPPLPRSARRLHALLLLLLLLFSSSSSSPGRAPGTGDRCLTRRGPASLFAPRPLFPLLASFTSALCTREPPTPRPLARARHFPARPKVGARPPRPAPWHGSACPCFSALWPSSVPRYWLPSSSRKVARKCDVCTCPKVSTRTMPPRTRSTVGGSPREVNAETGTLEKGPWCAPLPAFPRAGRR